MQNLNTGEAIVRIERPEFDFSLATFPVKISEEKHATKELVVTHSRNTYSSPKENVEELLRESMSGSYLSESKEKNIPEKPKQPIFKAEETKTPKETQKPKQEPTRQASEKEIKVIVEKKEETQHRYLQTLVKKMAESKGYKAIIEMPTADGKGSVDVCIEGNNLRIACEVSVTTDSNWELHNIEKCLTAGYDIVFVCCTEKKAIDALQQKVHTYFDVSIKKKIVVCEPEKLFDFLDQHTVQPAATETKIKGYRVKVEYDALTQEEQKRKRESIAKIVLASLRKMKK